MSDYQQKPNSGSLFRNDRKTAANHPDHKGSALIDGKEYWISAWINEAKSSGKKYFGLAFELKEEQAQRSQQTAAPAQAEFDDDVPF